MSDIYEIEVESIRGRKGTLAPYRDRVLLIVNVASRDENTPQYAGLQMLQRDLGDRGFTVLAFPCNQIGNREPGNAKEIETFAQEKYAITFPLHAKIEVEGRDAHVLYRYLCAAKKNDLGQKEIADNFEKFLVDRQGKVVARFGGSVTPEQLKKKIEALL